MTLHLGEALKQRINSTTVFKEEREIRKNHLKQFKKKNKVEIYKHEQKLLEQTLIFKKKVLLKH